ncbi:MAG: hypothetical protein LC660_16275 [Desulfobacteraceae bacterium]|nr:hypothetical protein [Desulfobacteraceae bacterium]
MTQAQIGQVFDTTSKNVLMHLKNIYKPGELELDAVISVGCMTIVKSM